jgi:coatomer subunit delta
MESHEEKIQEIIIKNKEQDAKEQAKLRMKQMEMQRREATRHARFGFGTSRLSGLVPPISISPSPSSVAEPIVKASEKEVGLMAPAPTATQSKGLQLGHKPKTAELFEAVSEESGISLVTPPVLSKSTSPIPVVNVPSDGVHLLLEERITLIANKDGGLRSMEVKGDMVLRIGNMENGHIKILTQAREEHGLQIKTHPNIDRKAFSTSGTIVPKDPSKPFPINQPIHLLRWRLETTDSSEIPLSINCWPSQSGDGSCEVNLEYVLEHENKELKNVVISIPIP